MYQKEITRRHRAAIVIAIDQSSSMNGNMSLRGETFSKAEGVSMVVGRLIDEFILRSYRDNGYRHYYDIALIGYSGESVYSLLGEELAFYPITMLAGRKVRKSQYKLSQRTLNRGNCAFQENFSMWVEPRATGSTPMFKMLNCVTNLVEKWCAEECNRENFPPLVFNITDGEATDCDYEKLRNAAYKLRKTGTLDGETLFMNIHITSDTLHSPLLFPNINEVPLSVRQAHLLADMSSVMPPIFNQQICGCRSSFGEPPYIAMSYNSSLAELITMLNIGSRSLIMGL
jgi:hypothetical protein